MGTEAPETSTNGWVTEAPETSMHGSLTEVLAPRARGRKTETPETSACALKHGRLPHGEETLSIGSALRPKVNENRSRRSSWQHNGEGVDGRVVVEGEETGVSQ